MRKGQLAVPALMLTFIMLVVLYLLWVMPEQRYELLFGTSSQDLVNENVDNENIFLNLPVGEIGKSNGEQLDFIELKNLEVSYPETKVIIANFLDEKLSSNIILNSHKLLELDLDEEYEVELLTNTKVGSPNVKIMLNSSTLSSSPFFENSKLSFSISKSDLINFGNNLKIVCDFSGLSFWSSQQCNFDEINIYRKEFSKIKQVDSSVFYLTTESKNSELMKLNLNISKVSSFPIKLLINNVSVYEGLLKEGEMELTLNANNYNLSEDNVFTVVASKGSDYEISDVDIHFYSLETGLAKKYLYFDLPTVDLTTISELNVILNIKNIKEKGNILLTFNDKTPIELEKLYVNEGDNLFKIQVNKLYTEGNQLTISSDDGRFVIENIIIKGDEN